MPSGEVENTNFILPLFDLNSDRTRDLSNVMLASDKVIVSNTCTVKLVYQVHSREPENVVFLNSCPLYTSYNYAHYRNEKVLYRQ